MKNLTITLTIIIILSSLVFGAAKLIAGTDQDYIIAKNIETGQFIKASYHHERAINTDSFAQLNLRGDIRILSISNKPSEKRNFKIIAKFETRSEATKALAQLK